ncbi:MAG TPA: peptide chain release factor-like protein [bacterium]|nr:peptide chain release factor-like protein [bacterium]HPN30946.1 peptide chain release factor-like protein [bacterium]
MFNVSDKKEKELIRKMNELEIFECDIEESFIKSSGAGGQKINKTSSCVYLLHAPTGINVKCSASRSQSLNRYCARQILLKKIDCLTNGKKSEEKQIIDKIRRRKYKRSKRAKEKILADKKHRSVLKKNRNQLNFD